MAIVKPRMTEEEFMRMPDDGRKYELVDGEIREVPASVRHDEIAREPRLDSGAAGMAVFT